MTVASHVAIGRLESAVGVENVLVAPDGLHRCAIAGAQPGAIVTPGSAAEVVEIVRIANDERLALCPVGAGTKLEFGPPPDRCDVAVELSRMSRIADYDPGDLTLSVEPGLPVPALAAALTPENQFVPLEGPCGVEGTGRHIGRWRFWPTSSGLRLGPRLRPRHGICYWLRQARQERRPRG